MDFATIVSAVASVGFPIVFCIILYKSIIDMQKQHKDEIKSMTDAIHNNTLAIQKLTDMLNKEE